MQIQDQPDYLKRLNLQRGKQQNKLTNKNPKNESQHVTGYNNIHELSMVTLWEVEGEDFKLQTSVGNLKFSNTHLKIKLTK